MRLNNNSIQRIRVNGEELEEVDSFTYLGSVVDKSGGTEADITARIGKARVAFIMMKKVWSSGTIQRRTKLRLFESCVKSVLLYGAETWRHTKGAVQRIQMFINGCLRRILKIWWPRKITNQELWRLTNQSPVEQQIKRRKWRWLGHVLRKDNDNTTRQSLTWNPQGSRARGRPKMNWRRGLMKEIQEAGMNWNEVCGRAMDRASWRSMIDGLCTTGSDTA